MPMLASECPGWICYAEKKCEDILPLISTAKSPQQILGALVKKYLAKQFNTTPDKIFHTTVMPCYDKKLEGSRDDFLIKNILLVRLIVYLQQMKFEKCWKRKM